jgi:hypothetical protein
MLDMPNVAYQRGEASGIVLARVLDALEAATRAKSIGPLRRMWTTDTDQRYWPSR